MTNFLKFLAKALDSKLNHPSNKNRTREQQKYRDKLAKILKADRASGEVGKLLAEKKLISEQQKGYYILAKYGFTQKWADKLIEAGELSALAENLDKFKDLDQKVAKALIIAGKWGVVAQNLDKFEGVDHNEIAKAFIEAGGLWFLAYHLDKFEGLDLEIAKALIEAGYADAVRKNIKSFKDS